MKTIALVFFLFTAALASITSTTLTLSSTNTLVTNVQYNVKFSVSGDSISTGSVVTIDVSSNFALASVSSCTARTSTGDALAPVATCGVTSSGGLSTITMNGIFSTGASVILNYLEIQFYISNPYTASNELITFSIKSGATTTLSTQQTRQYSASSLSDCSWATSSDTVSQYATINIKFTSNFPIILTSNINLQSTLWGYNKALSLTNFNNTPTCASVSNLKSSLGCTSTKYATQQILVLASPFNSNISASTTFQFSVSFMRNPPSTETYGPYNLNIFYNSIVSLQCPALYSTVSTPNSLTLSVSASSNRAISASFTRSIVLILKTPITTLSSVLVEYTTGPTITYTGTLTNFKPNSTSFSLSGMTISTSLNLAGWNWINPPSTFPYTLTVSTYMNTSGVINKMDTNSIIISMVPGVMIATMTPSTQLINSISTYKFAITTTSALKSGSFMNVVIPSTIIVASGSCSSTNVSGTCSVSGNNITLTFSNAFVPSTIEFTLSLQGSNSEQTSSSITAYTYYQGYTSLVDNLITAGPTLSFTAKPISIGSVTPSSTTVSVSTSYQFSITNADAIPIGGSFSITFPSTVQCGVPSLPITIISGSLNAGCTANCVSSIVSFSNCMQTSAKSNSTPIRFSLSSIINPNSLAASGYFTFFSYDSSSRMINYLNSSLSTFQVTMNTAEVLTFSITANNYTVNQVQTYKFTVIFTSTHITGDYLLITFPTSMSVPSSPTCTPATGASNVQCSLSTTKVQVLLTFASFPANKTIQFNLLLVSNPQLAETLTFTMESYTASNALKSTGTSTVTYLVARIGSASVSNDNKIVLYDFSNITLTVSTPFALSSSYLIANTRLVITIPNELTIGTTCSSSVGTCAATSSSQYTVTGIGLTVASVTITLTNITLPFLNPSSTSFSLLYDYNTIPVASVASGVTVSVYCTSPCKQCGASKTTCLSCLPSPNTFIYYVAQNSSCLNVCPTTGYYVNLNNDCLACNVSCRTCVNSTNCTSCRPNFALSLWVCETQCPTKQYNSTAGICTDCPLPCDTCRNQSFCLTCLTENLYNGSCVEPCPVKYYGDNHVCVLCNLECTACVSATNCTSCATNYFFHNYQCLNPCPDGYFSNTTNCTQCNIICATCSRIATNCTSCPGTILYNSSCYVTCPDGTYENNMNCTVCPISCKKCTSATVCSECNLGYNLYNNACPTTCPNITYPLNGVCTPCVPPCETCRNQSYCLSCVTDNFYNGACMEPCPVRYYGNNHVCVLCNPQCSACVSATNCTSCASNYFFYNYQCLNPCPDGYFSNVANCTQCNIICATCSRTATNCTSCPGTILYNRSCYVTCPDGTYENNMNCTNCPISCKKCASANFCSECNLGYYYYNNFCQTTCPNITYPDNGVCTPCTPPCQTCSLLGTTCTSCVSGYLMNNTCLSSCPDNTAPSNGTCVSCGTCNKCINLTSCAECPTGYLMFNHTCYSVCPAAAPIQLPDNTCVGCDSTCSTCLGTTTNCSACASGRYRWNTSCLTTCPTGTQPDIVSGNCIIPTTTTKLIYCPIAIALFVVCMIVAISKVISSETLVFTSIGALAPIFELVTLVVLGMFLLNDQEIKEKIILAMVIAGVIGISMLTTMFFFSFICRSLSVDIKYNSWQEDGACKLSKVLIYIMSMFSFKILRLLYSRLFGQMCFSARFSHNEYILKVTRIVTVFGVVSVSFGGAGVAGYVLYSKTSQDQTFLSAIETLIICIITAIVLVIDTCWNPDPYKDGRKRVEGDSNYSGFLDNQDEDVLNRSVQKRSTMRGTKAKRFKTGYDSIKEQDKQFSNIDFVDPNKYGVSESQQEILDESERPFSERDIENSRGSHKLRFQRKGIDQVGDKSNDKLKKVGKIKPEERLKTLSTIKNRTIENKPSEQNMIQELDGDGDGQVESREEVWRENEENGGLDEVIWRQNGEQGSGKKKKQEEQQEREQEERRREEQREKQQERRKQQQEREKQKSRQQGNESKQLKKGGFKRKKYQDQLKAKMAEKQSNQKREAELKEEQQKEELRILEQKQKQQRIEKAKEEEELKVKRREQAQEQQRVVEEEKRKQEEIDREREKQKQKQKEIEIEKAKQQQKLQREEQARIKTQSDHKPEGRQKSKQKVELSPKKTNNLVTQNASSSSPKPKRKTEQSAQPSNHKDSFDQFQEFPSTPPEHQKTESVNKVADIRKLEQTLKKNNIDPLVLQRLFKDNFDADMLNKLLSKESGIPKSVLHKLFNENNNPELMQKLFGLGNNTDMERLTYILKSGDNTLIDRLFGNNLNQELSTEVLQNQSKITKQFTMKTLGAQSPIPNEKLRTLFKKQNKPDMKKLSNVIGKKAELETIMENMLGEESFFDVTQLRPMLQHLKPEVIQDIFREQNQVNDMIIDEILNDKSIKLQELGERIFKHKNNVDNTRKILDNCSDNTLDNFKRLINQAGNLDEKLLDDFMNRPELVQKLFEVGLDPQFISKMLEKGSNIDLNLFEEVMMKAHPQSIHDLFEFFPETTSLDFDGIRMIFEKGNQSDPNLIGQLLDNPDLFASMYSKGNNDPKILKKLFQKGQELNEQVIKKLYGRDPTQLQRNIMGAKLNSYGNKNLPAVARKKSGDYRSIQHNRNRKQSNDSSMHVTNLGFQQGKLYSNMDSISEANNTRNRHNSLYMGNMDEREMNYRISNQHGEFEQEPIKKKKSHSKGHKTRRVVDVRHPSEEIYLQRIIPAHERRKDRAVKRQKKKGPQVMTEDNDVFDHDF